MTEQEIAINLDTVQEFRSILEAHKDLLNRAATRDTWITLKGNSDQMERGLATLRHFGRNVGLLQGRTPAGGVAVFSSYNDPSFGTLGMSLGAALLVCGREGPILLKFPRILESYARTLEEVLTADGTFPGITFFRGESRAFMEHCLTAPDIHTVQIYGGTWVEGYAESFAAARKVLKFEGPGNNAAVVEASADLALAAHRIVGMKFALSGQACVSINRVLVDDRVDRRTFDGLLQNEVQSLPCSRDPFAEGALLGPIRSEAVLQRFREQFADALAKGARPFNHALEAMDGGLYIAPTLLFDATHEMRTMCEETFAPVLSIQYAKRSQLAGLANSTPYGLSASVFGEASEVRDIMADLAPTQGSVLLNATANEAVSLDEGHTGPWGGYGISSFYLGPNSGWLLRRGPTRLVEDFSRPA